jgi:hypothetical protein
MQKKQWSCDWFVVFVVIALLLIPLYYLIPGMPLFKPFEAVGNASIYGFIVFVVLIFDFLWWVVKESRDKRFKEKVLTTLGLRLSGLQIAAGLAIGCSTEVLTQKVESRFSPMVFSIGLGDLLLVPPIEEVLFRGTSYKSLAPLRQNSSKENTGHSGFDINLRLDACKLSRAKSNWRHGIHSCILVGVEKQYDRSDCCSSGIQCYNFTFKISIPWNSKSSVHHHPNGFCVFTSLVRASSYSSPAKEY